MSIVVWILVGVLQGAPIADIYDSKAECEETVRLINEKKPWDRLTHMSGCVEVKMAAKGQEV